jgi:hypothetical protein
MNDFNSSQYWEDRYKAGGNSGAGSRGHLLIYKSHVINNFIRENDISSVADFGCGDASLAMLIDCQFYLGYDVSHAIINSNRAINKSRRLGKFFFMLDEYMGGTTELVISIDVIFHLVEDEVFDKYMRTIFQAAEKYVIIYSSNQKDQGKTAPHVKHREFLRWVQINQPGWLCFGYQKNTYSFNDGDKNGSFSDFYFFSKSRSL